MLVLSRIPSLRRGPPDAFVQPARMDMIDLLSAWNDHSARTTGTLLCLLQVYQSGTAFATTTRSANAGTACAPT